MDDHQGLAYPAEPAALPAVLLAVLPAALPAARPGARAAPAADLTLRLPRPMLLHPSRRGGPSETGLVPVFGERPALVVVVLMMMPAMSMACSAALHHLPQIFVAPSPAHGRAP